MEINDRHQYFNIYKSNCFKCKHFDEDDYYCPAFPNEIPLDIAQGDNKHLTIQIDQSNDIVFEKIGISWSLLALIKDINDEQEVIEFAEKYNVTIEDVKADWTEFNRYELVPEVEFDENGEEVYNMGADWAGADPFAYGRLRKKADAGDEEAKRKMEEMDNTPMYRLKKSEEDNLKD